jgi:hypothetical protein
MLADLVQCPITGWPADKKLKEIGTYSHLALEQDMEGEFSPSTISGKAVDDEDWQA